MTSTRIALALLIMISSGASQPVAATSDPVAIKIVTSSARQGEDAEWALARFEAAGLELPSLTIIFYDDYQSCGMREGVLRIAGEDVTIHECENDPSRSRCSLLHELAHAWDHVAGSIDADTRIEFLRLRGLQSWDDDDLAWNQRGEEQTAEIIAWGLMHQPAPITTSVGDRGAQDTLSLTTAFILLTGIRPPFGDTEFQGVRSQRPLRALWRWAPVAGEAAVAMRQRLALPAARWLGSRYSRGCGKTSSPSSVANGPDRPSVGGTT